MKEEKQNTLTATIGYGLRTAIVGAWWGEKFFALTLSFHEPFRHGAVVRLDAQEIQTGAPQQSVFILMRQPFSFLIVCQME